MIRKTINYPVAILKFNLSKLVFTKWFVIIILGILTKGVQGQGCSVTLKINDPSPVCSPLTVDLSSPAITSGSTNGLKFSYYLNSELTIPVPSPTKADAGTYYIKGVLTDPIVGFVAASVKVTVIEKPKLIITNPVIVNSGGSADLTLPQITSGSDAGLSFSYWYDSGAKIPLSSPRTTVKGEYFIKGISEKGCINILPITVNN